MEPRISVLPVLKHSYLDFQGELVNKVILTDRMGVKLKTLDVHHQKDCLLNLSDLDKGIYYIILLCKGKLFRREISIS